MYKPGNIVLELLKHNNSKFTVKRFQSTWSHFRRDFPSLTPKQLHHVLNGYILGPRVKKRPPEWTPDPKDFSNSTEEGGQSYYLNDAEIIR